MHRASLATVLVLGLLPGPALAGATAAPQQQSNLRFDPAAPRKSLLRLVDDTQQFVRVLNGKDAALLANLGEARKMIVEADDAELAAFAQLAPQLDEMMLVMAHVRALIASPPAPAAVQSTGFPAADYPNVNWTFNLDGANDEQDPEDLPDDTNGATGGALCDSVRKSDGTLFGLLNGVLLAEAVQMVASRACDQVVVVIGGGNGSLFCIITDLIFLAVRGANDNINYCEDQNDGAELHASYLRLDHIHTDLGTAESNLTQSVTAAQDSINGNVDAAEAALTGVVNASTDAVLAQVQASENNVLSVIQAGQDFTLRIEIEKALRYDTRLAVFFLPEAYGGQLSLVRQIVVETITNVLASGQGVTAANTYLTAGDAAAANGKYKEAFHNYSQAYFQAVRILGDVQ